MAVLLMPRPGTPVVDPAMVGQLQTIAQDAMRDSCVVTRGGSRTFDSDTMQYTSADGSALYTGPCRVQPVPTRDHTINAGGDVVTLRRYSVSIPISVTGLQVDDHLTVTASTDPQLIGHALRVTDVTGGTFEGQRHLICLDDLG